MGISSSVRMVHYTTNTVFTVSLSYLLVSSIRICPRGVAFPRTFACSGCRIYSRTHVCLVVPLVTGFISLPLVTEISDVSDQLLLLGIKPVRPLSLATPVPSMLGDSEVTLAGPVPPRALPTDFVLLSKGPEVKTLFVFL